MNVLNQPLPFLFGFAEEASGNLLEGSFDVCNDVWMVTINGEDIPLIRLPQIISYTQSGTKVRHEETDRDRNSSNGW